MAKLLGSSAPGGYVMDYGGESRLRWEKGSIATVFGGSGFLGRHTVEALARDGWRVCAAMRRPELAGHLQPLGEVGQIYTAQANVRFPASVRRAVRGAEVVVNLVGIQNVSSRQTFEAVHVTGARTVAKAAQEAGVKSVVHVSAIGASERSPSAYDRCKAAGEKAVLEEFPRCVILRPSVVFGPEDRLFNHFAATARLLPFLPLIGAGETKFQPVYVGDVAAAIATACTGRARLNSVYELGGPEIITLRGLLKHTLQWSGRQRLLLDIPIWIAKLGALMTVPLPDIIRPFTFDQIWRLESDNVVTESAEASRLTLAGLGIEHAHTMESIVPSYLERFHPRGQFAHYRW
jgi:NADH dehydrogenase